MKKITITMKPTNACNMRCRHCYHAEEGFDALELDRNHARRMMEIAIREYDHVVMVFHGGEPTLWGEAAFQAILDDQRVLQAEKPGITFTNIIQTNGLLLDDEWIRLFKDHHVHVGISYDGPHNDDLRSHSLRIYQNMQKMKAAGVPFGVLCVESQKSIHHLLETYEWFKAQGFDFKILALFMNGAAQELSSLELDFDDYVTEMSKVYRIWLHDTSCNICMHTFEEFLKLSDENYCLKYGGSCVYHRICINPNGDLYPCGRPYDDAFCLGNIESYERISDAFQSPAYQKFASLSEERNKQCQATCKFYGICKGGCVSSAILEGFYEKIQNPTCIRAGKLLSGILQVNQEICREYKACNDTSTFNPRALRIMKKVWS